MTCRGRKKKCDETKPECLSMFVYLHHDQLLTLQQVSTV
jgi:hypothetical protein